MITVKQLKAELDKYPDDTVIGLLGEVTNYEFKYTSIDNIVFINEPCIICNDEAIWETIPSVLFID